METEEKNDFWVIIKEKDDKTLIASYLNRDDYQPDYIDMVREELENRGYSPSEISSHEEGQAQVIARMRDEELVDVFTHADDYPVEWVQMVEEEIERRNLPMDAIVQLKEENGVDLRESREGKYIVLGYILSVFGGLIGLIMACTYAFAKERSVSGEKFYRYNQYTRKHGKNMLWIFVVINALFLLANIADF